MNIRISLEKNYKKNPAVLFGISAILLYFYVAYVNAGFIHADEHYQLIEFANYKLGLIPEKKLAWEFNANARPGLQPLICFLLFKLFALFGALDGYTLAFLLRIVSAIYALFSISLFNKEFKHCITKSLQWWFVFFSFFLWFLPYINVRYSSENWSGLSLLLTLVAVRKCELTPSPKRYLYIGLLFGFSTLFKYQAALFAFGYFLWLLFVKRTKPKNLLMVIIGFSIILSIGVMVDYWLYSKITLAFVNYFKVNLIQGVASKFGTSPPYEYIIYILMAAGPFGVFILASFLFLWVRDFKNSILWIITPYLIIHSIIPHKELRFLFPLANICPFLFFMALQKIIKAVKQPPFIVNTQKYIFYILTFLFFLTNLAGIITISTTGPGINVTPVTEYIYKKYDRDRTNVILVGDLLIYYDRKWPWNSYYNSSKTHKDRVMSIWQKDFLQHKKAGYKNILVINKSDVIGPRTLKLMNEDRLIKVYQNIPYLTSLIYELYDPGLNNSQIFIYEFR